MRLFVNSLSVGSLSGQHVVYGFLRPVLRELHPEHTISVLHYESQPPPEDLIASGVEQYVLNDRYRHWSLRTAWEFMRLPNVIREINADVLLNVSGSLTPYCPVPQVVLCQNPWAYRTCAQYTHIDRIKGFLQRRGYRRAFRQADMMIYISNHLRDLYRSANKGHRENSANVAYVGIDDQTFDAAAQLRSVDREPLTILSVSAMARWKGAETLVEAVRLLHNKNIPARLKLVGPWPDTTYEAEIRQQISRLKLDESVELTGKVSREELHRLYATSKVFCLMSSCESFGIPATEAMAFGTPVVSTNCCAIAEICEGAGLFGPVGDPEWTAAALETALSDDTKWAVWSEESRLQTQSLHWDICAQPLLKIREIANNTSRLNAIAK